MIKRLLIIFQSILRFPVDLMKHNCISSKSRIMPNTYIRESSVGKYSFIGAYTDISYANIGNYTCIANGVVIGGMEHPYWDLSISPKLSSEYVYGKKTYIGNDVWIASGCIIKQGVKIGDGAVIGANSFVNRDIPPYAIAFGTPAKIYKFRFGEDIVKDIQDSEYWNNPPKIAIKILNKLKLST